MRYLLEIGLEVLKVLIGLGVAGGIAYLIAYQELTRRAFWGRITFSLLTFHDEKPEQVVLDTLLDLSVADVWVNNRILLRNISKAAEQCTIQRPWIWLDGPAMYHVKSGVRHQLSSHFSQGAIARATGKPVQQVSFLLCLCATHSKNSNTQKLRVFVLQKQVLQKIGENVESYKEQNPGKEALLETVQQLWLRYQAEPRDQPDVCVLHSVRIYQTM